MRGTRPCPWCKAALLIWWRDDRYVEISHFSVECFSFKTAKPLLAGAMPMLDVLMSFARWGSE